MKLKFTIFTLAFLMLSVFDIAAQINAGNMGLNRIGWWDGSPASNTTGGVYYNDLWGYVDGNGSEYAVLGTPQRIYFIDVTDPTIPTEVAFFTPGSTCVWRDFKTYDKYVYAVSEFGTEGLLVYDMSGLDSGGSITLETQLNGGAHFAQAHNLYIDEANARLYVAGAALGGSDYDIIIYSLANPAAPTLLTTTVAQTNLPGDYVHDIFVKNNIAFASHEGRGVYIYDYTDPTNPIFKDSYAAGGYNHSSWITEDDQFLIFAEEVGKGRPLVVLDVSDLSNISVVTTFKEPLLEPINGSTDITPHNPFVRGDKVIISNYEDGTTIYDLSPLYAAVPQAPELEAYYDTYNNSSYNGTEGNWGTYPFFPSGNIISSDVNTGLYIFQADIPLPVQLKSFNAIVANRTVALSWATAAESNNDYFSIERSEDGVRFEAVGKVKGAGTTGVRTDYAFTDDQPLSGVSYYRLKQTDFDGTESFSRTVSVEFSNRKAIELRPNIITNGTQVSIGMKKFDGTMNTSVWVTDSTGKIIAQENWGTIFANENRTIDVSGFAAGVYQVQVKNGFNSFIEKLVVLK